MADKQTSDLFMIVCPKERQPLQGECQVDLKIPGKTNELISGFAPPRMFEITEFSFGLGGGRSNKMAKAFAGMVGADGKPINASHFAKAAGIKDDDGSDPTAVNEIQFSRFMDLASPMLLSLMIKRTYIERIAIVKRKAAGGPAGGDTFMRIDFRGVVLVDVSWSDGEPVKEDYTFQARATTMRYRPQLENGDLGYTMKGFKTLAPDQSEATL